MPDHVVAVVDIQVLRRRILGTPLLSRTEPTLPQDRPPPAAGPGTTSARSGASASEPASYFGHVRGEALSQRATVELGD